MNYKFSHGYIVTDENFPRIVGRIYGGDGSATYQLAARPYDECPVHGHANLADAFAAALIELVSRGSIVVGRALYHD